MVKAPGIWVCDNLGDVRRDMRDRISDELARLITEPSPHVDMRELFTTATLNRVPIDCTFAATTIRSPFHRPDILQRSIILKMDEIPENKRDGDWYYKKLAVRHEWVAEHLVVLQRFFRCVRTSWQDNYKSGHRLRHFEQSLLLMGAALGESSEVMADIITKLPSISHENVADKDPMIEALKTFAEEWPIQHPKQKEIALQDIIGWVQGDNNLRFNKLYSMGNLVLLGRYLTNYKSQIFASTKLHSYKKHSKTYVRIAEGNKTLAEYKEEYGD